MQKKLISIFFKHLFKKLFILFSKKNDLNYNLSSTESNILSNKYLNTYNNNSFRTIKFIEDEISNIERKVAELNVSYQSFLQKLKELPNNNFKESNDLKNTLKYLQDTIEDKNKKLKELKFKQQKFLIQSKVNN